MNGGQRKGTNAHNGESKTTRIMMAVYRTSLPVWDLENFRLMDFCWHECTWSWVETKVCLITFEVFVAVKL